MTKHKLSTLQDVKNWKALKKEELDLEKVKFDAEKHSLKQKFAKDFGKVLLIEGALIAGEKLLFSGLKAIFKPSKKKNKKKKDDKENVEEVDIKIENEGLENREGSEEKD